jgi:DNA-binding LacI/PurR family transcriptional regulator
VNTITLKDIAAKLKLSTSTVSRALRDHPRISPKTKERVLALAREYDYQPDSIAKSLQTKRTMTIGVIVPQIKQNFFASVINGIENVAYVAGYMIIVSQSDEDYQKEVFYTRAMAANRVAGLLVSLSMTTRKLDHFKKLQKQGMPIVFFDRVSEDIIANKVAVDDYQGALDAVAHLIETGCRRIAHLAGPPHLSIAQERLRGYRDALDQAGLPYDQRMVVHGGLDDTDGVVGFSKLLSSGIKPDAIFAVNDPVATGAFLTMKEHGLTVPRDLALVGFSNNAISSLLDPPLTTVSQPSIEMGKVAVKLLLEQIEQDGGKFAPRTVTLDTKLIIRRSSLRNV